MEFRTSPAPHTVALNSVRRVMGLVLLALLPGIALYTYFCGWGLLINIVLATASALLAEALALRLRNQPVQTYLTDGSAVVTAVLFAVALPPLAPWWLTVSGTAFGLIFAKHVFGGLGYNLFNPAMVGFAAVLVSFPTYMRNWPTFDVTSKPTLTEAWHAIFSSRLLDTLNIDAITGATPLMTVRTQLKLGATMSEVFDAPTLVHANDSVEWIAIGFLAGGVGLLLLRIIRWQIPVAMLGALLLCAVTLHAVDPGRYPGPMFHLFGGASVIGAFFIATDPVSAATSPRGRLIFGAGIGILTYLIRTWGGYPEGLAFAVLLMNAAAPLIDRYTVPRVYGHEDNRTY